MAAKKAGSGKKVTNVVEAPLGSGARFKAVEASAAKGGAADPAAVAAAVGRKKYGKQGFQKLAAAGRKRAGGVKKAAGRGGKK